ncbi:MAG TPA: L-threonylcarbamoyladenylate synthase [Bryobacteraceae bacterium]|nr:L-threonylcarbamoyladenylate synthase [Bryobacteraceae bacterium]
MPKTISVLINVSDAAARIRQGGVVAFPTETVYGLGANALDPQAVAKIFELKGRPHTSPLIVHVSSIEMAKRYAAEWPPIADELARKHWPGPLTLVVSKSPEIPDIVTAGLATVGLRMPNHPLALELIEKSGVPIAAPSANRFTHLSPTTPEHVEEEFGGAVEILEGGPSQVGIESTVVSVVNGELKLLRPGMIPIDAESIPTPAGAHPAPGMYPRHYSPRTRLILVEGPRNLPDRAGAYVWHNRPGDAARRVRMPGDPPSYAARLYDVLHQLDSEHWPWIAVECPPDAPEWSAIRDRLQRASAQQF